MSLYSIKFLSNEATGSLARFLISIKKLLEECDYPYSLGLDYDNLLTQVEAHDLL